MGDTLMIGVPVAEPPEGNSTKEIKRLEIAEIKDLADSGNVGLSDDERDMLRWADDGGRNLD